MVDGRRAVVAQLSKGAIKKDGAETKGPSTVLLEYFGLGRDGFQYVSRLDRSNIVSTDKAGEQALQKLTGGTMRKDRNNDDTTTPSGNHGGVLDTLSGHALVYLPSDPESAAAVNRRRQQTSDMELVNTSRYGQAFVKREDLREHIANGLTTSGFDDKKTALWNNEDNDLIVRTSQGQFVQIERSQLHGLDLDSQSLVVKVVGNQVNKGDHVKISASTFETAIKFDTKEEAVAYANRSLEKAIVALNFALGNTDPFANPFSKGSMKLGDSETNEYLRIKMQPVIPVEYQGKYAAIAPEARLSDEKNGQSFDIEYGRYEELSFTRWLEGPKTQSYREFRAGWAIDETARFKSPETAKNFADSDLEFTGNLRPEAYVEYKDGARTVRIYDVTYQSLVNNSTYMGEARDKEVEDENDKTKKITVIGDSRLAKLFEKGVSWNPLEGDLGGDRIVRPKAQDYYGDDEREEMSMSICAPILRI